MAVSTTLLDLLQSSQNFSYCIAPSISVVTSSTCIVKALVVRNKQQQLLQLLVPQNYIVDLDELSEHGGDKLIGMSLKQLREHFDEPHLVSVPAVPEWHNLLTIVDSSLLPYSTLMLDSGDGENVIKITGECFKQLTQNTLFCAFSSPAPLLNNDPSHDEEKILDSVKKFTDRRICQRLEQTLDLPPIPTTAQRIIQLRADPNANVDDLVAIVQVDPSLAAQVVSWAASPYYCAPGKIKSVHDAIVRVLGFEMVLNMTLGLSLGKSLSTRALNTKEINDYWDSAILMATSAETISRCIPQKYRPITGLVYLAGLLSNFGYLILAEVFPVYIQQLKRVENANPHMPAATIETHSLGVSSNQIASWLLENWSMPKEVVTALRQQDTPLFDGEDHLYANIIFITKQLLARQGLNDAAYAELPDALFSQLNLEKKLALEKIEDIANLQSDNMQIN